MFCAAQGPSSHRARERRRLEEEVRMRSSRLRSAFVAVSAAAIVVTAALIQADAGSGRDIRALMLNMGVERSARGMVHVVHNKAQAAFQIKGSHLSRNTTYDVIVNGAVVDQLRTNGDGTGKVAYRSKAKGHKTGASLPYELRGASVKIARGGTVVLTADVPQTGDESHVLIVIEQRLTNMGVVPTASASAEFESRDGHMRFKVGARGLPPGTYDVIVGGVDVGDLVVTADS